MKVFNLTNQIERLAKNTNFRVLKAIKKYKVITTSDEGVNISIIQNGPLNYSITFDYRASLKFTDIGTGNGYLHGFKIKQEGYSIKLDGFKTGRKPKRIVNRKIYWMINSLREIGSVNITEQTLDCFTLNLIAPNVNVNREN